MDQRINTESLRKLLVGMKRKDVRALCQAANVSLSTVSKFRSGDTDEMGSTKVDALSEALAAKGKPTRRTVRA